MSQFIHSLAGHLAELVKSEQTDLFILVSIYFVIMICSTVWCWWMVNLFPFVQSLKHTSVVHTTQQLLCYRLGRPNNVILKWTRETFSPDIIVNTAMTSKGAVFKTWKKCDTNYFIIVVKTVSLYWIKNY